MWIQSTYLCIYVIRSCLCCYYLYLRDGRHGRENLHTNCKADRAVGCKYWLDHVNCKKWSFKNIYFSAHNNSIGLTFRFYLTFCSLNNQLKHCRRKVNMQIRFGSQIVWMNGPDFNNKESVKLYLEKKRGKHGFFYKSGIHELTTWKDFRPTWSS